MARNNLQGTHTKGPVRSPDTRTPAPTASGQGALNACPKDGQPRQHEHLTVDTAHNGRSLATPQYTLPARKSARCGASAASPRPHNQRLESTGTRGRVPAQKTGSWERESASHKTLLTATRKIPPRAISSYPRCAQHPAGQARRRASTGSPQPDSCAHSE